jgi:hypothetical protein
MTEDATIFTTSTGVSACITAYQWEGKRKAQSATKGLLEVGRTGDTRQEDFT